MDIEYKIEYHEIDNTVYNLMKQYLEYDDIDKIYKEWNFFVPDVEKFSTKYTRFSHEFSFIGEVLSTVTIVQPYNIIESYLKKYRNGNTCAFLSFVLQNIKWSVLESKGKRIFEGSLLPEAEAEAEERQEREEGAEKDKKQILLEKVQKEIIEEYPAFKEVFYKKYRDNIASMVFNLNGNTNDSELLERLIEDEMIEDFSNFKIKQIENLLKNS